MLVTRELLSVLEVSSANADRYLEPLNAAMALHAIDTRMRVAHFLAQVVHESSGMRHVVESMNYSAERLLQVFPRHFATLADAQAYARQPERIGSRVYGGRMGNRDEASGDGFRYRGRGLIQLTGKNNYRAFARWVGEDVVAHPDLVGDRYAVHSAVFFWDTHQLNALADIDDMRTLTRRINGGLNGFDDRFRLLEKAREAMRVTPELHHDIRDTVALVPTHRVIVSQLNLRRTPRVTPAAWVASLPQGWLVQVLGASEVAGWVRVRVQLGGTLREGYVAERYLAPLSTPVMLEAIHPHHGAIAHAGSQALIPAVHMRDNRPDITRALDGGRAFPLGEPDRPRRNGATADERAVQVLAIVNYLDSASPAHKRYTPKGGTTYCNIYAYDVCTSAGAYLPRVWWTDSAIARMQRGEDVAIMYGETVRELNANALHDWLEDHGRHFGWHQEIDLTTLQAAANAGEVCVIVGKRKDLNRSGHITAVVPEHNGFHARRNAAGEVVRPVESQAGVSNFRFAVGRSAWWLNTRFQSCAFWRHP